MKQVISQFLIFCILVQTNFIAYGQVRTDGTTSTTVTQAANGVDVVNIANANSNGLSHNKYIDFNVAKKGLILNNSKTVSRSQLGGMINGNSGLRNQARLILNEVSSSNRSKLNGYIEVHGQAADVIIANPNGISCNGCGFINTPSATLTTGKPIVNGGELQRFDVNGGKVTIGELGLDATRADYFDIVSRAVEVNGDIHAKNKLQIITGRNDVDYKTKVATKKADDGSTKPEFSIDSSALGGMYAGAISLVGTEDGVGVKAPENAVASLGDFNISADGKIVINRVNTRGSLIAESKSSDIEIKQSIQLENGGKLKATKITQEENAIIVSSIAQDGTINGSDLTLEADEVELNSEVIGAGSLTFKTNQITHGANADVKATDLSIVTDKDLHLDQGKYLAFNSFNIETANLTNDIELTSAKDININASNVINNNKIEAGSNGTVQITATSSITNNSEIIAGKEIELVATNVNNNDFIASQGDLNIRATNDVVNDNALLYANGDISIKADGTILNNYGDILAYGDINLGGLSQSRATQIINAAGYIETLTNSGGAQGSINLAATNIDNLNVGFEKVRLGRSDQTIYNRNPHTIQNHEWELLWDIPGCCALRSFKIIRKIRTDRDTVRSNGDNAYILSAGDISLDAEMIRNDKSAIYASRDLAMTGGGLNNVSTEVYHRTIEYGTMQFKRYEAGSGHHSSKDHYYTETFTENASRAGTTYRIGTIQAGGKLTGNLGVVNNSAKVQEGVATNIASGKTDSSVTVNDQSLNLGSVLGRGNLFIPSTDIDSPFSYETRGQFVNTDDFLSSDYFLDQLGDGINGFNPDENLRRLGDSFIETRIIRDQIFTQTGLVTLDGFGSDMEQMQALYDNAANQMNELDLQFGVKLTAEQVQNLTQDIIWMEKIIVNGQEVLAPKVYLSNITRENLDVRGSKIVAKEIDLSADRIMSEGIIRAKDALKLNAGLIVNDAGLIKGGKVDIKADNIINDTSSYSTESDTHNFTSIGRKGEIISDGDLSIDATENIISKGGVFQAGDDLALKAGKGIEIEAIQETSSYDLVGNGLDIKRNGNTLTNTHAQITAGGNLSLDSGESIKLHGADLKADGSIELKAKENIEITSTQDVSYSYSDLTNGKTEQTRISDDTTTKQSVIDAGDSIVIHAAQDVLLEAAKLKALGKVDLIADEGSINLVAAIDSSYEKNTYEKEGTFTVTNADQGHDNSEAVGVQIFAGGGVNLEANEINIDVQDSIKKISNKPGYEFLDEIANDPRIDWNEIQSAYDQWDEKTTMLNQTGALLVSLAVTIAMGPAGAGALAAMSSALLTSLASQAAISLINNGGKIGAVFKELTTSESLRGFAMSAASGGIGAGPILSIATDAGTESLINGTSFSDALERNAKAGVVRFAASTAGAYASVGIESTILSDVVNTTVGSVARSATESLVYRKSFSDSLKKNTRSDLVNLGGRLAANEIGSAYSDASKDGKSAGEYVAHKLAHGVLGCAMGEASGGDCGSGATAAVSAEIVAESMTSRMRRNQVNSKIQDGNFSKQDLHEVKGYINDRKDYVTSISTQVAGITASARGKDVNIAKNIGQNSVENNALETVLDIGFVAYDIYELAKAKYNGDEEAAKNAMIDLAADSASILIPFVPAGMARAARAARMTKKVDKATDAIKVIDKIGDISQAIKKTSTGAENIANGAKYTKHRKLSKKYGKDSIEYLENGKIRYKDEIKLARTQGEMKGRRVVKEWNPKTNKERVYMETVDHKGRTRIIRPQVNKSSVKKHYHFDETGLYKGIK